MEDGRLKNLIKYALDASIYRDLQYFSSKCKNIYDDEQKLIWVFPKTKSPTRKINIKKTDLFNPKKHINKCN